MFKEYFTKKEITLFELHFAIFMIYVGAWLRNRATREVAREHESSEHLSF